MANELASSASPYLRQHASDPVDWREWNSETLADAKQSNKIIFLSIGYSSCHWCHVMQHETFQNSEAAQILNRSFVSIKVDREERPDLDEVHMTAVQLQSGRGGWPMSVFLTPDCKPILAGTYFPVTDRPPVPGFLSILNQLETLWSTSRQELLDVADEFANQVQIATEKSAPKSSGRLSSDLVKLAIHEFKQAFDSQNGGFGSAPKFPPHSGLQLLIGILKRNALGSEIQNSALNIAATTLAKMALGGIHDVVGGGFHRYSTDAQWKLPHFEKMLSDNALLLGSYGAMADYLNEIQPNRAAEFRKVASGIHRWLFREMRAANGMLCSALDADVDGEEGETYVWTMQEVAEILPHDAEQIWWLYQFEEQGNYHEESTGKSTGKNLLLRRGFDELAPDELLKVLLETRNKRPQPQRDDKCVASWNGLLIQGLVHAGYKHEAAKLAEIWYQSIAQTGYVPRFVLNGIPHGRGFLDDYSNLALAFLMVDAGEKLLWHERANDLAERMFEEFYDPSTGGFFSSGIYHEALLGKSKPVFDQPTPSANSVAIQVAQLLNPHDPRIQKSLEANLGWIERAPQAAASLVLNLLEFSLQNPNLADLESASVIQVEAENTVLTANADGWAEGRIRISIPAGVHINAPVPAYQWLKPLVVGFEGITGVPEYPEASEFIYLESFDVPFAVQHSGVTDVQECEIIVKLQACTESECYEEQTFRIAVLVHRHGAIL